MSSQLFTLPNLITTARLLLALVVFQLILAGEQVWLCFWLTLVVIAGDFFDGLVARQWGQSTRFGAWLDIAVDRIVELGYWLVFSVQYGLSSWVPLIFLIRGVLVDGIRSFAAQSGREAFGPNSMMQSPLGIALVSSRFSRTGYAILKAAAFGLMILAAALPSYRPTAELLVWLAVVFCLLRGLPVLIDGLRYLDRPPEPN